MQDNKVSILRIVIFAVVIFVAIPVIISLVGFMNQAKVCLIDTTTTTTTTEEQQSQFVYVGLWKVSGDYVPAIDGEISFVFDLAELPFSEWENVSDVESYIESNLNTVLPQNYYWSLDYVRCSGGTADTFNGSVLVEDGLVVVIGYHAYLQD